MKKKNERKRKDAKERQVRADHRIADDLKTKSKASLKSSNLCSSSNPYGESSMDYPLKSFGPQPDSSKKVDKTKTRPEIRALAKSGMGDSLSAPAKSSIYSSRHSISGAGHMRLPN